jgi:hypothetical protein
MNRDEMIEEILDKMEQMSTDEKEEFLVILQIINGETPDDQAAALRVKRKVMEWQKKGYSVDDTLIRYFAG